MFLAEGAEVVVLVLAVSERSEEPQVCPGVAVRRCGRKQDWKQDQAQVAVRRCGRKQDWKQDWSEDHAALYLINRAWVSWLGVLGSPLCFPPGGMGGGQKLIGVH